MEDKMKNIVVLRNLPSNLVEEAFVIIKGDRKQIKSIKNKSISSEIKTVNKPKDYIVKEAEMVITNYVSNLESQRKGKRKNSKNLEKKYKRLKIATIILSILLIINLI